MGSLMNIIVEHPPNYYVVLYYLADILSLVYGISIPIFYPACKIALLTKVTNHKHIISLFMYLIILANKIFKVAKHSHIWAIYESAKFMISPSSFLLLKVKRCSSQTALVGTIIFT